MSFSVSFPSRDIDAGGTSQIPPEVSIALLFTSSWLKKNCKPLW